MKYLNRIFLEIQIVKQRTIHSNINNNTNKNLNSLKSVRKTVGLQTDNKKKVLFSVRKVPGLIDNSFGTNCKRLQ